MSSFPKSVIASLLLLPAGSALAQTVLDPIVVSATGFPTPSSMLGNSVTVITAEEIERRQIRTIPALLQTVPGLNVVQTGGPGGQTSVFTRGTNSNHTKVLIDGIDVSDPSSPNRAFDFGPLTTFDIERVEILRGPQSGLYGSDAMGGVISITTKKGKGPTKVAALVEGGSFGTFNQAGSVSGGTENAHYAFNVSHMRVASTPVTPDYFLLPGQRRNNDFYDNVTLNGKAGADLSDIFSVNFVARHTRAQLGFTEDDGFNPITFAAAPNSLQSSSRSHQFSGLAEGTLRLLDGRFNNNFGATYLEIRRDSFDPEAFGGPRASDFYGERKKFYWKSDFELAKDHKLLAGIEQETEKGRINNFGRAEGSSRNLGSYAELQSGFFERFFVTANIRHDQHEHFGDHTTWRVAPALLIPETGTKLKASYGTGFHAPSIDQLFGPFGANLNLLPEELKGYDYGFEQSFWEKRLQFGVTWFRNDITNLITFAATPPFPNINVAKAKTDGFEAFVAVQPIVGLNIRADYSRTNAIDAITNLPLRRRPWDKWSIQADWQATDKLTLSASSVWVSSWMDVNRATFAVEAAPGYQTVNLAANYAVNQQVNIFGRIDNLLNKHYENPLGFEKTGIGVYGGLRVSN